MFSFSIFIVPRRYFYARPVRTPEDFNFHKKYPDGHPIREMYSKIARSHNEEVARLLKFLMEHWEERIKGNFDITAEDVVKALYNYAGFSGEKKKRKERKKLKVISLDKLMRDPEVLRKSEEYVKAVKSGEEIKDIREAFLSLLMSKGSFYAKDFSLARVPVIYTKKGVNKEGFLRFLVEAVRTMSITKDKEIIHPTGLYHTHEGEEKLVFQGIPNLIFLHEKLGLSLLDLRPERRNISRDYLHRLMQRPVEKNEEALKELMRREGVEDPLLLVRKLGASKVIRKLVERE
jgi:hypothetical protein